MLHPGNVRATHWSTHLFLETSKFLPILIKGEAAFDDWRLRTAGLFGINFLVSLPLLMAGAFDLLNGDEAVYVFPALVLDFPSFMYAGWLDPKHGELIILIIITLLHVTRWSWIWVRVIFIDISSSWIMRIVSTILLPLAVVNLLRITHWYWRNFLGSSTNSARRQAQGSPDDEASAESYSDDDSSVETHSDGLLGSIYRDQLDGRKPETNLTLIYGSEENGIYEDDINSELPYHDDSIDSSSAPADETPISMTGQNGEGPSTLPDEIGEGPSTKPTHSHTQWPQDPLEPSQNGPPFERLSFQPRIRDGPHFKELSLQPRFRWQENVPLYFNRGLSFLSLGFGTLYFSFIGGEMHTESHYCKMKTDP